MNILNEDISILELSVRGYNVLLSANIRTVGQLVEKTEFEILKYKNMGKKNLNEYKEKLSKYNLFLKDDNKNKESKMSNTKQSTFMKLFKTDVSEYVKKKGNFNYLSWAYAVQELKRACPTARWGVTKAEDGSPFFQTACGYFVEVWVDVDGVSLSQVHPVLDNRNQAIEKPTAFQINTSLQRALAKCIALHGLGLYIFAGEDLPEPDALTPAEEKELYGLAKPLGKKFVDDLKSKVASMDLNANNYDICLEKINNMIKEKK